MNIRQLESFLTIVQLGSFAAAAERLHLTQSTISARIQELEEDLGVELFHRAPRQIQLTMKGRELVVYAERALALFAEIRAEIGAKKSVSGILRIGVVELIANTWLPSLTSALNSEYPGLTVECEVGLNPFLMEGIRTGNLDIVLIAGDVPGTQFKSIGVGSVQFGWMASPNLSVPNKVLEPHDMRKLPVIYQGAESFMNQMMNDWLGLPNARRQRGTSCTGLGAIASLTMAGMGVCLLPLDFFEDLVSEGKLRVLDVAPADIRVPFTAIFPDREANQVLAHIATLCAHASTFDGPAREISTAG